MWKTKNFNKYMNFKPYYYLQNIFSVPHSCALPALAQQ